MAIHQATRRELLAGSGALFAWAFAPKLARAEGRDPRFLTIVLRGALDGLAAVAPVGDPDWIKLRGDKALKAEGNAALALDEFYALNPAMATLHRLYRAKQAIVVHAAATPYRERSHFDGQDVLESGLPRPAKVDSGWLNRALGTLEAGDRTQGPNGRRAFAVGPVTPLVVRGPAPVFSWAPPRLAPVADETTMRLIDLYRHTDPELARVMEDRMALAPLAPPRPAGVRPQDMGPAVQLGNINLIKSYFAEVAGAAGKVLASADGPRVGALALDGWDTHANEGAVTGRLANLLGALDGALAAIEQNMGAAWQETVVALITEFGRTARINGTDGTDHGTATVALLAGGALKGGRVIADWPGLKEADLHDKRDLKATTDLRAVLKGLLRDHLRVEDRMLAAEVFPGSDGVTAMEGLVG
jgi:uncharacterized protein (DUF1501 family)